MTSYKDLPLFIYQFQTKFRNELRAKSGIMRGREFLMKDMYSFTRTEEELNDFYEQSKVAYRTVAERVGLGNITYQTEADGSVFGPRSDEYQTVSEAGEDTIYADEQKMCAINKEVYTDEMVASLGLDESKLVEKKSIEIGNIFPIGTMVSDGIGFKFKDVDGKEKPVIMGCYGIGLGRLMGTIVEVLSDDKGIVWPESVAPFKIHLIEVGGDKDEAVRKDAEVLYKELTDSGIEVLYDNRDKGAGEKFADSDLIGIPHRVVVSGKTIESGSYELKNRKSGEVSMVSKQDLLKF